MSATVDPVKRKVISELFFAPSVVLPIVGGVSAGLMSWAGGGVEALSLAALGGVLGGIGWMVTRIIFQIETITESALQLQLQQRIKAESVQLDELMGQLRADGDPRTQNYLSLLRSLRDEFWTFSNRPNLQQRSATLRERVGDVFDAAVGQLRETLRLARLAASLDGEARTLLVARRESAMLEIQNTIDQLRTVVSEYQDIAPDQPLTDLKSMREELEASIRVAKRTEDRMREMEGNMPLDSDSSLDSGMLGNQPSKSRPVPSEESYRPHKSVTRE